MDLCGHSMLRRRSVALPLDGGHRVTTLDTPLVKAAGFGQATAKSYSEAFGIHTVRDLVYHYPRRYEERGKPTDIASLVIGEDVTVQARVLSANVREMTT